jgi:hypothetical protein
LAKESGMGSDTQAWYGGSPAQPGAPGATGTVPVTPRTGPAGPGGPSRRAVALALLGSTAAACVTGAMIGLLRPAPAAVVAVLPSVSAAPPTSAAATSDPPSAAGTSAAAAPSSSASPSVSPSPSARPTPSPDQASFVQEPWKDPGLDFAVITAIRADGVKVAVKVDRLQFLTGDAAKKYYAAHPDQPVQEYAIVNASPKIYTYTLVPGAPLFGAGVLTGSPQAQPLDAPTLVDRVGKALAAQQRVYVWLRHQDGGKGWTTYLAEQYLP